MTLSREDIKAIAEEVHKLKEVNEASQQKIIFDLLDDLEEELNAYKVDAKMKRAVLGDCKRRVKEIRQFLKKDVF